jgi:hypothetical protein
MNRTIFSYTVSLFFFIVLLIGFTGSITAQQKRLVEIVQANQMRSLKQGNNEVRRLLGNVIIKHDQVIIHCDSLYEYININKIDAFGNVKIIQDSSALYGDILHFDKISKKGRIKGKVVKLVDQDLTLIANFLDFDINNNSVDYSTGGIIRTKDSHFSSQKGFYYSNDKLLIFSQIVSYKDADITLNTDSLRYYTQTEAIVFFGPTQIYNKDNFMFCESGTHNRKTNQSEFFKNTFIDTGNQLVFGDSLFYDKNLGFSKILGNGCLIDTAKKITVYGNEIKYFQETEYSEVSKNPLALFVSEQSDTIYLRANILVGKSIKSPIETDTTMYNLITGVGDVRFFREDIQGVCDSMIYNSYDSIMYMQKEPIIWNDVNQLTANSVVIHFRFNNIQKMLFNGSAFIASQEDSVRFNQIKGRDMIGYFVAGKLSRLNINGNGETVYYIRDKGELSAVNRAESSTISIGIRDNKVTSIMFRDKVKATLYPIDKVELKDIMIKGFQWHQEKRPETKTSIIPLGLNLEFYKPVMEKANSFRSKKRNPADTLSAAGFK